MDSVDLDGGLWANDPSLVALSLSCQNKIDAKNILLLSISTGFTPRSISASQGDWGILKWAPQFVGLLMDLSVIAGGNVTQSLLGDRYFRVNPVINEDIRLDAYDQESIKKLLAIGENCDLSGVEQWIEKNIDFSEFTDEHEPLLEDWESVDSHSISFNEAAVSRTRSCNII